MPHDDHTFSTNGKRTLKPIQVHAFLIDRLLYCSCLQADFDIPGNQRLSKGDRRKLAILGECPQFKHENKLPQKKQKKTKGKKGNTNVNIDCNSNFNCKGKQTNGNFQWSHGSGGKRTNSNVNSNTN